MNKLLASASEGKFSKTQEHKDCFELARSVKDETFVQDILEEEVEEESQFVIGWKLTKRFWSDVNNGWVDDPYRASFFNKNEGIFRVGKWVVENVNQWPIQLIDIDEFNESKVSLNTVVVRKDGSPMIIVSIPKRKNKAIRLVGKDTEISCTFEEYVQYVRQGAFRVIWDSQKPLGPGDVNSYLNAVGAQE